MATINLGRIKPVFRGAYNGATAYVVDDIVTSSDETFICILASTGNATSNATYWTKLAAKGTDGTDVGTTITTQGDILYRDGSGLQRLAKPASNKYLQNTSGGVLSWEALTEYNDDKVQNNIALLGFKCAVNGSLAKYNLVDQIIDEYSDATGIDAGNSTNEVLAGGGYLGGVSPTITHDADATGTDGAYTWYKWTDTAATGSYSTDTAETAEWLVVAGGGGGYNNRGSGGGGAGGYRTGTTLSLGSGVTYTVTIGAGGTGGNTPTSGGDSSLAGSDITTITSTGGGNGSLQPTAGGSGGSGGGGTNQSGNTAAAGAGNTPAITQYTAAGETTTVQGYAGGTATSNGSTDQTEVGGGGGGASSVGTNATLTAAGNGGAGYNNDITGSTVGYAGGGGASSNNSTNTGGTASHGGGAGRSRADGNGDAASGTANTGGGGGGHSNQNITGSGGDGGTGVVILRKLTNIAGSDLTLQSTANTASATATKGDMICLIEDQAGTATLNTDIKGYISANGGTNWTEGTLVDEGSWGTNKKILAFHDQTIANSGTDMRYKITTHNQVATSLETKIHATSIGWA